MPFSQLYLDDVFLFVLLTSGRADDTFLPALFLMQILHKCHSLSASHWVGVSVTPFIEIALLLK